MRALSPLLVLGCVVCSLFGAGCPPSEFDPVTPDAGFVDAPPTLADIGRACVYDPQIGDNPTNQCANGTECVIVTRDGRFNTLGMDLVFWEDQVTVAGDDGTDTGYCSVVGNVVNQPVCPAGSFVKLVRSPAAAGGFAAFCVATCGSSAQCDGGRVCDARYLDDGAGGLTGTCVSRCVSDLNHCMRTGVFDAGSEGQISLVTAIFADDLAGASACNASTGVCEDASHNVLGTDGARCSSTRDCAAGLVCYQPEVFVDEPEFGFCAKRCSVQTDNPDDRPEQGTCDGGEVCQPGLSFGYFPSDANNGMVAIAASNGQAVFATREGICLDVCTIGVTECVEGATCGATEPTVMGQAWIGVEVCAPPAIREAG
jgi:hypothetical protein